MAEERKIDLKKQVFGKSEYLKTIDTSFKELGVKTVAETIQDEPNVEEFFALYNSLFYDIPAEGSTNSHQFLVEQSGEYINFNDQTEEIQALRAEITNLRRENLNLQINNIKELAGDNVQDEISNLNKQLEELNKKQDEAASQIQQTNNTISNIGKTVEEEPKNASAIGYFN